ncbi:caspase family protein [Kordia sp.]|uniref:caspase family protein n=1 Tax=Kordia sp. TaxID=1965332 RepID=UPI003D27AC76
MKKASILLIFFLLLCSFHNINRKNIQLNKVLYSQKSNLFELASRLEIVNTKNSNLFIVEDTSKTKQALIIANGIYQQGTKWRNINSHNDINIIKSALKSQGFSEKNIQIEKDLTFKSFIKTFKNFEKKLKKDDIVFIHISSHGQQIYDNNNDEKDSYDEAIIPVDAPKNYNETEYTGDKHIRDEKLGELCDNIRKKIGVNGNFFVTIDACHSGTGTRGYGKYRGAKEPFEPKDYKPTNVSSLNNFGLLNNDKKLAPAVYFYSSSANQLNYEYKVGKDNYVGSLSYALSKALTNSNKNTTYQGLFDNIRRIMANIASEQTPEAEGILNQKILGGQIVGKKEYFLVTEYKYKNDGRTFVRLNGGKLQGLHEGSKVALYDIDGLDKEMKIVGTVIKTDVISSQVQLNGTINEEEAINSWVVITERNYGNMKASISLNLKQKDLQNEIKSIIDTIGFISIQNEYPDLIIESVNEFSQDNLIQIYTKDDYLFWKQDSNNIQTNAFDIIEHIKRYVRVNFIKRLEMQNKDLDMTFDFIPVTIKDNGMDSVVDKELSIESKKNASGIIVFKEGDNTYIDIKNNSKMALYYTLLDIQPNNIINILIPEDGYTANDFHLKAGESYKHQIEFYPPYGTEIFKLVASEQPLDLRPILRTKGKEAGKKNPNPFELLFKDSYKNNERLTRGDFRTLNIPTGAVNIYTIVFEIQE